ncbi:MAG: (2Fe-2S)-binding protein [Terriglobales bacterium]
MRLALDVNGRQRQVEADPEALLLNVLREQLNLRGTKYGCGEGECGACSVLLDGQLMRSCQVPAAGAQGRKIVTIEGLAGEGLAGGDGQLDPLQQAFLDEGAWQCGFCTAGMLIAAKALLAKNPRPNEEEIVAAMTGNICRCGTYPRIIAAIQRVARGHRAFHD